MAEQSEFERDLRLLESSIHQLESQYNMFFAGSLPKPPLEARSGVEALFRRYDRTYIQSYADRFRLGALQTRFSRFCELWDRGIRAHEEGRPGPFQHLRRDEYADVNRAAPPPSDAPPPEAPASPPERAVRVTVGEDRELGEKIHDLYEALTEARRAAGSRDDLPFDRFSELVQGQLARLEKGGSREVVFRVATQDGKVTFTARTTASGAAPATAAREPGSKAEPRKLSGE